jgi:hypothetical protein
MSADGPIGHQPARVNLEKAMSLFRIEANTRR